MVHAGRTMTCHDGDVLIQLCRRDFRFGALGSDHLLSAPLPLRSLAVQLTLVQVHEDLVLARLDFGREHLVKPVTE